MSAWLASTDLIRGAVSIRLVMQSVVVASIKPLQTANIFVLLRCSIPGALAK